ncbi:MAG: metal-sensing transcriptional repressor [Terrimonas sp.]|nr:metal-sensing transcriptional repressor [Terrimonas sp.]
MLPADLTKDIVNRLSNIKGQIEGIGKMLVEGADPEQILIQFKAAQKGLDKAHYLLLDEVYRKALAIKIVKAVDACPGNCGNEDRIKFIKEQFPHLKLNELSDNLREMQEIEERLYRHASKNAAPGKNPEIFLGNHPHRRDSFVYTIDIKRKMQSNETENRNIYRRLPGMRPGSKPGKGNNQ